MKAARRPADATPKSEDAPFPRVWEIVARVPRGRVVTYGQLSDMIDRRLTPVGIGWAIRAAPDGAIPWHRVVNASGAVSTDKHHLGLQRTLLEAEGVVFVDGAVDLERFRWKPRSRLRSLRSHRPEPPMPTGSREAAPGGIGGSRGSTRRG